MIFRSFSLRVKMLHWFETLNVLLQMIRYWIFFNFILFYWEIIIAKKNIVTFIIKAYGKQAAVVKKKSNPRPGKPTKLQTRFSRSGQVLGSQTRFQSSRVSGHSKLNPTRPNISPRIRCWRRWRYNWSSRELQFTTLEVRRICKGGQGSCEKDEESWGGL